MMFIAFPTYHIYRATALAEALEVHVLVQGLAFLAAVVCCLMAILHVCRHCLRNLCRFHQFRLQALPSDGLQKGILQVPCDLGHPKALRR